MKRQVVRERKTFFSFGNKMFDKVYTTLDELKTLVEKTKKEIVDAHIKDESATKFDIILEYADKFGTWNGSKPGITATIAYNRLENDTEFEKRKEQIENIEKAQKIIGPLATQNLTVYDCVRFLEKNGYKVEKL